MMRYKIVIEYDGTNLVGWQKQLDGQSVQGFLERAVYAFCQEDTEVHGAGRTDAGVHALAQVAHFDLEKNVDEFTLCEAMNAHLRKMDAPICILAAEKVNDEFHARYSAKGRSYIYRITNRRAPLILDKNRSWAVGVPLDIEKMRIGAKFLIGNHDFTSFRAAKCQATSPIKTIDVVEIHREGDNINFLVEARSFLHHQVRNIVGTLEMVGDGRLKPEDIKTILEAKNRSSAGATAPACGLYLNKIVY